LMATYLRRSDCPVCRRAGLRRRGSRNATAGDYSDETMRAAIVINVPNYASAVVTTREVVEAISSH
jgi:hypothetical protein